MTGFVHLIVPRQDFQLISEWSGLSEYRFATETARHWFCPRCGIKPFYQPRSHPEAFSLHFACIDAPGFKAVDETLFDGRHWDQAAEDLRSGD